MSIDSFVTAVSDVTNIDRTGSIVGTKGRFKVIHIDETDEDEKELLQTKIDELTRELNDVKGDLMIFRQKRHRARNNSNQNTTDDNSNSSNKETNDQQNILLKHLEQANERINQLDNDLKLIVCQKEELEIERDSFKTKYSKLNQELNKMLNGNEKHVIDIEHILSENRYLKVKMNELVQEKNYALANASKYKDLLQTHRSAYNRLGKVQSSGTVLTHKQVQNLLKQSYLVPASPEIDNDLRSIAEALYENLKDKNVTITHQRKTNKVLASRVAELEKLLAETSFSSKSDEKELLQTRIDELTRELNDVKGDLMIFRQKRHRARNNSNQNTTDDNSNSSNKETNDQQNILLKHLEQANERISQLDNDLKLIVCQKEELEIERDSFKTKYSKLNQELNKMLNGNEKHVIDIEHILSENRYLKVKMNELAQEKNYALANASKYKDLLQTHRSAYNRLGKVQSSGTVLTHKQVQNLLKQSYLVPASPEIDNDLRSIAEALYENLKDKNVTITHQRKTNKVLANRVAELEKLLAETSFSSKSEVFYSADLKL
ncbi:unnamed protein product [Adineta steineri]|uniref:Uncharacterized protein n=1 Tax=Adineta steineri TaxID=433720 RepID=A0A815H2L9_9BILA|nr:unnamed protein product [Adineta steineri]